MTATLRDVVERILAGEGALVERIEPDGLEVVAPLPLQQTLLLPEWSRLGFGAELPSQAQPVSIESEWLQRLERLLGERGRYLRISLQQDPSLRQPRSPQQLLRQEVVLENATHRSLGVSAAATRYLLLTFQITAVSDEKREDLVHLCINESTSALADHLVDPLLASVQALDGSTKTEFEDRQLPPPWPAARVFETASRALPSAIRAQLAPFLSGMERRMNRDLQRLYCYYNQLRMEVAPLLASARASQGEAAEVQRHSARLQAIEREYQAKVADLRLKYAMAVEVRFTQALRVALPVWRLGLTMLRRKRARNYFLDWDPLSKKLERPACEACCALPKTYWVCDDQLHLVCSGCLSPCSACARAACRACHPVRCLKCGQAW